MKELLDTACKAAVEAGQFIQQGAQNRRDLLIEQKSLYDYVSEVDRGAEAIIREHISQHFPDHAVLGEELGSSDKGESDYQWVIDPLDGTTNFVRGIPHYAVSIAIFFQAELIVGVVFDPVKNDLFTAVKGQGAFLNKYAIQASDLPSVEGALLATGIPFNGENLQKIEMFSNAMQALLAQKTAGIRRLGSAALDLAYVAAGRYDGFWEANLKIWDIAAGVLLVQESGGYVSDFQGSDDFLRSGHIIASGSVMHSAMCSVVGEAYRDW